MKRNTVKLYQFELKQTKCDPVTRRPPRVLEFATLKYIIKMEHFPYFYIYKL